MIGKTRERLAKVEGEIGWLKNEMGVRLPDWEFERLDRHLKELEVQVAGLAKELEETKGKYDFAMECLNEMEGEVERLSETKANERVCTKCGNVFVVFDATPGYCAPSGSVRCPCCKAAGNE